MDRSENREAGNGENLFKDTVAVITGASSGIGRATAHEFARRGYKVVVAARNKPALAEVVEECRIIGSPAHAVSGDVTKEEDVNELAREAIEKYGRIDIWVNNAAVTLFGRFDEVPIADIRRVVETNLFGYIYGARAAISHFRERGSGVLINVSSIVAEMGQPYTGAYAATKAAEKALSESLSQELADQKNIHICTVMPAVIDTPFFQHGANYTGKEVVAPRPVHPPEMVAEAIVDLSANPRREIIIGSPGYWKFIAKAVAPDLFDKMIKKSIEKKHFRNNNNVAPTPGNLYDYALDQVSGGWREQIYEEESSGRVFTTSMVVAGAFLGLLAVCRYKGKRERVKACCRSVSQSR